MFFPWLKKVLDKISGQSSLDVGSFTAMVKDELFHHNTSLFHDWCKNLSRLDYEFWTKFDKLDGESLSTTLLHMVSYHGRLDIVKCLIGKSDSLAEHVDSGGYTPLYMAALNGHLEVVKYFVDERNVDPNVRHSDGYTPLHMAALNGHLEVVKYLVDERNVDLYVKNRAGYTPLHVATLNGHLEVVRYLVDERNVDLYVENRDGYTPLQVATLNGHLEVVRYLVDEKEVAYDVKDIYGNTPLHMAISNTHLEVVKYLAGEKNVDLYVKNRAGYTPCFLAARKKHREIVQYLVGLLKVASDPKNNGGDNFPCIANKNVLSETTERRNGNLVASVGSDDNYSDSSEIQLDESRACSDQVSNQSAVHITQMDDEQAPLSEDNSKFKSNQQGLQPEVLPTVPKGNPNNVAITNENVKMQILEQKSNTETNDKRSANPNNGGVTAPSVQSDAPDSVDKNSGKKGSLVADKDSKRVKNAQVNSKQPSYPDKNNPAPQNIRSKWPFIATSVLTMVGVVSGIAIAVYLEMLAVGIAVGACCLVAAAIIYYCNGPSNSLEKSSAEAVEVQNRTVI